MAEAVILIEDLPIKDPNSKAKLITISGQLDESNVDMKAKDIYKVFEEIPGKLYLVFDFAGLDYMNSKSIGYLTDWYGKLTEKGGKIFIARTKPNIKDILQVVGLTQLIQTFDTLDAAKQAVMQESSAAAATPAPTLAIPAQTRVATPAQVPAVTQTTQVQAQPAPATPAQTQVPVAPTPQPGQPVSQTPATPPVQTTAPTSQPETYKLNA